MASNALHVTECTEDGRIAHFCQLLLLECTDDIGCLACLIGLVTANLQNSLTSTHSGALICMIIHINIIAVMQLISHMRPTR